MRKIIESNSVVLTIYGCLLVCLASFFVVRESHLIHQVHHHHDVPLMFLIRLGVFWFVSLMIAVVLYLMHLSYYHLLLKAPENMLAKRAGYLTFWLGIGGAVLVSAILYFYTSHPEYFYL